MKKQTLPEARLITSEVTLRDLTLTNDVKLTKKSLVRYLALSAGLISPNESRTTCVDLLETLLKLQFSVADADVPEIVSEMQKIDATHNEKAIRYHLGELTKAGVIERNKGKYRFKPAPFADENDAAAGIEHALKQKAEQSLLKIKTALELLKQMHEQ